MSTNALSIYFFSMDLVGPQHACIGLAQALKARGHRVRFFARSEAAARFRHYGFECFDLVDNVKQSENVVKDFIASFKETGLFDDRSPLEKMKIIVASAFFKDETNQCLGYEPQIRAILAKERPDLVVVDSEVLPPSLICQKDFPWVMIFCSNPVGLFNSPDLPPFTSDLPTDPSFRPQWEAYAAELDAALYKGVRESQRRVCEQFGCPRSEPQVARVLSPHLNLYQFPAELDYDDRIQLPANCHRVDAYIRDEPTGYQLPVEFKNKMKAGDKLIYLSMGSMGSFDVSLMQKLVATLAKTPHWYIVSKGPLADQYELPENMIGEAFVPQTRILPLVDAAIMHGGWWWRGSCSAATF